MSASSASPGTARPCAPWASRGPGPDHVGGGGAARDGPRPRGRQRRHRQRRVDGEHPQQVDAVEPGDLDEIARQGGVVAGQRRHAVGHVEVGHERAGKQPRAAPDLHLAQPQRAPQPRRRGRHLGRRCGPQRGHHLGGRAHRAFGIRRRAPEVDPEVEAEHRREGRLRRAGALEPRPRAIAASTRAPPVPPHAPRPGPMAPATARDPRAKHRQRAAARRQRARRRGPRGRPRPPPEGENSGA